MNCPHCAQPIDPKLLAQALAKRNSGKGSRPGSAKNARNPYGRKGKPVEVCSQQHGERQRWNISRNKEYCAFCGLPRE